MIDNSSAEKQYQSLLYSSKVVTDNYDYLVKFCEQLHKRHQYLMPGESSSWTYSKYNFFTLMGSDVIVWKLLKELKIMIVDYLNKHNESTESIWIESWLNYHTPQQLLKDLPWHNHHEVKLHGYISIRPHNTKTIFFESSKVIDNKVGTVMIGPGANYHKVEIVEPFDTPRITIAFDIHNGDYEMNLLDLPVDACYNSNYIPLV